ncbi:hypothetical protein [Litorisediminicola beolgyonensis]|uniref:Uncharacterized protein n=1 Tax=Litorisediminicola beolgyonensis TaxID=1173614 RepID=A0ABW3ZGS9_9RHOB
MFTPSSSSAPDSAETEKFSARLFAASRHAVRAASLVGPAIENISIPVCTLSRDASLGGSLTNQGRHLARQEAWEEFCTLIRRSDASRATTPSGRSVAGFLAEGAAADAVGQAGERAAAGDAAGAWSALEDLTYTIDTFPGEYPVVLVAAQAHLEIARLWLGDPDRRLSPARRAAAAAHLGAARRFAERFDPIEADSPALAELRCNLLSASRSPAARVADDYEDLIDLDPRNPRHPRALGRALLPRHFGSYGALETQARRTAHRTTDIWGAGAYAWTYLDALAEDEECFRVVDAEFFIEGLHDILDRSSEQYLVNLLAARTAPPARRLGRQDTARARILDAFDWIVRDHLRELQPSAWVEAATATGRRPSPAPERFGESSAFRALRRHFAADLAAGRKLSFDASGCRLLAAG